MAKLFRGKQVDGISAHFSDPNNNNNNNNNGEKKLPGDLCNLPAHPGLRGNPEQ